MTTAVIIIPFVFVIAITWIKSNEKYKRRQLDAEIYFKSLEKGQPLPDSLFVEKEKREDKPLNQGIILISAGIGLMLFLWIFFSALAQTNPQAAPLSWIASVGLIPFLIGVAFLIIHFIEKKKDGGEDTK
jgi:hypothetical protein